jgi:hypothetical protein
VVVRTQVYRVGKLNEKETFLPVDTEKMQANVREQLRELARKHEEQTGRTTIGRWTIRARRA